MQAPCTAALFLRETIPFGHGRICHTMGEPIAGDAQDSIKAMGLCDDAGCFQADTFEHRQTLPCTA